MEILSAALVGVMAGTLLLWRIPARACDQCEHCLSAAREAETRKKDDLHQKMHAWYGGERCPICAADA